MLACFHAVGYIPDCKDLLNSFVSGSAIIMATSLRILAGKRSGPHDLFVSNLFRIVSVSSVAIVNVSSVGT